MGRIKTRDKRTKASAAVQAAMGCRVHSGWAALVLVAGPPDEPVVLDRRRIVIADPEIAGSKQPYHYVETWPLPKAQEYLNRCRRSTNRLAQGAFVAAVEEVRAKGQFVVGCGILTASGRPAPSLEEALSSHAMLHTAEGEFYRNAVIEASERCDVPVTRLKEKQLLTRAAEDLDISVAELQRRLTELGRPLGPPWTQDEKCATLTAWMVLAG